MMSIFVSAERLLGGATRISLFDVGNFFAQGAWRSFGKAIIPTGWYGSGSMKGGDRQPQNTACGGSRRAGIRPLPVSGEPPNREIRSGDSTGSQRRRL